LIQEKQLGTGHSVKTVFKRKNIVTKENIMILLGDHPLIKANTIKKLYKKHKKDNSVISMITSKVPSYRGIYKHFYLGVYFDEPMKKGKDSYCGNPKFYVWNGNGSFGFLKDNVSLFENSEINDFLQKLLDKPLVGIPKRDFNSYLKNIKN
ncbi:MAG: hypothetical protein U9Q99_01800, partial [Nanoarchaeota archaeon]|nr:hypothetical protein [Nanoarchaeota archaeon]